MESSQNIVILGDLNEDLLNENYINLRDILLTNSLQNVITVPTRGRALLDPVIVSDDLTVYDSGVLTNPNQISDHSATFFNTPTQLLSVRRACRRNLVFTDLLAFAIDFLVVAQVYSGALRHFFRSLTTAGDNRDRPWAILLSHS